MTTTEISVKMIIDRWNASIKSCDGLLKDLTDEALQKEIVQGKNRGIYLLGHLVAVHDAMIALLAMGEKLYPELHEPFITQPDKTANQIPTATELRKFWLIQTELLKQKIENMTTEQWFEKHTAVSEADFANEPHRNKLNIIITRTSHLQYHIGQLRLLK
jgi:uncharacterized glyoxalase superfamily metalloenzyme YdcJ